MADSPVINDSDEFVPMPTPDQVVTQESVEKLDPIPFQFNDIRALAQRILKRATEQGQQKIAAAQKQVAAMEKQASDKAYKEAFPKGEKEGFAKGEKEGREAARNEMLEELEKEKEALRQNFEPAKAVLEQLAGIMNENRQQLLAQAEGDLLLLSLDIAKRLMGRELSIDPDAIRPVAIDAIGLVTDRSGITARVNPDDYKAMEESVPDLKLIFPDLGAVTVEPDPSIERGGLVATTREAEVDMRIATRLAAFEEAILGFSGDAAVAPWSAIPQEMMAEHASQIQEQAAQPPEAAVPEAATPEQLPHEEEAQPEAEETTPQEPPPDQEPGQ